MTLLNAFFSLLDPPQPPEPQLIQTFVGAINANITVTLAITTVDTLVHGTLTYTRSGISIPIIGTLIEEDLLLHEFDKKGNITGIHVGHLSTAGYEGTWSSPSLPGRSLPFFLELTAEQTQPMGKLRDLTGLYQYGYGAKNRFGQLHIQQVGSTILAIAMLAATGEPIHNQVSISRTTVKLAGNKAIFARTSVVASPLVVSFFNGGANVCLSDDQGSHLSERPPNQPADMLVGNYIRTSIQPPRFTEDELIRML